MIDEHENMFSDSNREVNRQAEEFARVNGLFVSDQETEHVTHPPLKQHFDYRGKVIMMSNFHKMRPDPVTTVDGKVRINGTNYPISKDGLEFSHLNKNSTPVYVDPWHPVLPWERVAGVVGSW